MELFVLSPSLGPWGALPVPVFSILSWLGCNAIALFVLLPSFDPWGAHPLPVFSILSLVLCCPTAFLAIFATPLYLPTSLCFCCKASINNSNQHLVSFLCNRNNCIVIRFFYHCILWLRENIKNVDQHIPNGMILP